MPNNNTTVDEFMDDFTADPSTAHLFKANSENVFSVSRPEGRREDYPARPKAMTTAFRVCLAILKVTLLLIAIAISALLLKFLLVDRENGYSFNGPSDLNIASSTSVPSTASLAPEADDSQCGRGLGWISYRDEKCFKLIRKWTTRDDAVFICKSERLPTDTETPSLVTVNSIDEQTFLTKLMFANSELNVWIGARRRGNINDSGVFHWDDGMALSFTHWAPSAPTNQTERRCVEMQADFASKDSPSSSLEGKWRDVSCQLANYVVCQKMQYWSLGKLQRSVLESRKELADTQAQLSFTKAQLTATQTQLSQSSASLKTTLSNVGKLQKTVVEAKNKAINAQTSATKTQKNLDATIKKLEKTMAQLVNASSTLEEFTKNPVPIGFLYVQLPNQTEPNTLWPSLQWEDISPDYSSLFFRVLGNDSAPFGTKQLASAPRITQFQMFNDNFRELFEMSQPISLPIGDWSMGTFPSQDSGSLSHKFFTSADEVRPQNTAVRIWRRSG